MRNTFCHHLSVACQLQSLRWSVCFNGRFNGWQWN